MIILGSSPFQQISWTAARERRGREGEGGSVQVEGGKKSWKEGRLTLEKRVAGGERFEKEVSDRRGKEGQRFGLDEGHGTTKERRDSRLDSVPRLDEDVDLSSCVDSLELCETEEDGRCISDQRKRKRGNGKGKDASKSGLTLSLQQLLLDHIERLSGPDVGFRAHSVPSSETGGNDIGESGTLLEEGVFLASERKRDEGGSRSASRFG